MTELGYKHVIYNQEGFSSQLDCSIGNAIFSKLEIKESAIIKNGETNKTSLLITVEVPNFENGEEKLMPLSFCNTRFAKYPSKSKMEDLEKIGIAKENFFSNQQLSCLINQIDTLYPSQFPNLLVSGSFNSLCNFSYNANANMQILKKSIMLSSKNHKTQIKDFTEALVQNNLETIQNYSCSRKLFHPPYTHYSGRSLDYIFVQKQRWNFHICVKDLYVYHTNASDHLPFIVDLYSIN